MKKTYIADRWTVTEKRKKAKERRRRGKVRNVEQLSNTEHLGVFRKWLDLCHGPSQDTNILYVTMTTHFLFPHDAALFPSLVLHLTEACFLICDVDIKLKRHRVLNETLNKRSIARSHKCFYEGTYFIERVWTVIQNKHKYKRKEFPH